MSKRNHLSFFKILVGDQVFTKLKVPPAFLMNLKGIKFPTEATISLMYHPNLSWKVKMEIIMEDGGGVYFTEGWEKLWEDIKLEIGDFLVFYLVGLDHHASFQLRAFDQTCRDKMWECHLSSTSSDKNEVMSDDDDDDEEEFLPKYPFFQRTITRNSLIKSTMRVPMSFARRYVSRNCTKKILTFETGCGQSWQVVLTVTDNSTSLNGGLSKFLKENSVQVGNMCTFKLFDKKLMLFRVYIQRGSHEILSKRSSNMSSAGTMHGKLDFSDVRPPRPGSGFASNYPFFQVNITNDNFYHNRLLIPWAFAKDNMNTTRKSQILTFQTGGVTWPVNLRIQSHPNQARLHGGITRFMKENNVKVGDFLTFELVNKINVVFRSSIYKGQRSSRRYGKNLSNSDFVYY